AASPIPWLPLQFQAYTGDVAGKHFHVEWRDVMKRNAQVRNVVSLGEASAVLSLFQVEFCLLDLWALRQCAVLRNSQFSLLERGGGHLFHLKVRTNITHHPIGQIFFARID